MMVATIHTLRRRPKHTFHGYGIHCYVMITHGGVCHGRWCKSSESIIIIPDMIHHGKLLLTTKMAILVGHEWAARSQWHSCQRKSAIKLINRVCLSLETGITSCIHVRLRSFSTGLGRICSKIHGYVLVASSAWNCVKAPIPGNIGPVCPVGIILAVRKIHKRFGLSMFVCG